MIWAAIPLKSPGAAKSRLSNILDAQARQRLQAFLARQVVAALVPAPDIARVLVVTPSAELARMASDMGATALLQMDGGSLPDACGMAVDAALKAGASGLLIVLGDVPLIDAEAIGALVKGDEARPCVRMAPDEAGIGTNALFLQPPGAILPQFGADSLARHIDAAVSARVPHDIVPLPQLVLDIDQRHDLRVYRASLECGGRQDLLDELDAITWEPVREYGRLRALGR